MTLLAFDHVNIRTANLESMIDWYGDILGLNPGNRPDFPFPGAWLYLGDKALVHLVKSEPGLQAGGGVTLEHFAFRATGMPAFLDKLQVRGVEHSVDPVPGFPVLQVNIFDPDGNHIHVDFDTAEYVGQADT